MKTASGTGLLVARLHFYCTFYYRHYVKLDLLYVVDNIKFYILKGDIIDIPLTATRFLHPPMEKGGNRSCTATRKSARCLVRLS